MSLPLSQRATVLRKNDMLSKLYERNQETGNYIIEVALDRYGEVFNDWDHASFRKRDMNPELAFFLEDCIQEIPAWHSIDLFFYLPKEAQNPEREKMISELLWNYYNFYVTFEERQLQRAYKKLISYVLTAFLLLTGNILMGRQDNLFLNTLAQGLLVGGWVFLWEPISFLFMKRTENLHLIRTYTRLAAANVFFRYEAK